MSKSKKIHFFSSEQALQLWHATRGVPPSPTTKALVPEDGRESSVSRGHILVIHDLPSFVASNRGRFLAWVARRVQKGCKVEYR